MPNIFHAVHNTLMTILAFESIYFLYKFIQEAYEAAHEISLKGKNILITGSASGIGRLTARRCAFEEKAHVIIIDINRDAIEEAVMEIKLRGGSAEGHVCDIAKYEEVEALQKKLVADGKIVDILINNAGIVIGKNLLDLTVPQIRKTLDVNLTAHFYTYKVFLPDMIKRNSGQIVSISSAAGVCNFILFLINAFKESNDKEIRLLVSKNCQITVLQSLDALV